MDAVCLTVPSKTFLLGEYVALHGGPALLLATSPRFQLNVTDCASDEQSSGIHPHSPAGQLIQAEKDFYQNYHLQFRDPYHGLGGFGASSAQFILVKALRDYLEAKQTTEKGLLSAYLKFAWHGRGLPPSGADLVAQLYGGLCYFYKREQQIQIFSWPFANINYALIHTGAKLATHAHLETVNLTEITDLETLVRVGLFACEKKDENAFINVIKAYAQGLTAYGLVTNETSAILKILSGYDVILASKGCGAMGSDVILVLYDKSQQEKMMALMKEKNLNLIMYGNQVESGLNIGDKKSV